MQNQSKSHRLKASDVAALLRLVSEVAELPHVARLRRAHLLQGLCGLLKADKGVYALFDHDVVTNQWNARRGATQLHQTPASELRELSYFYESNQPRDPVIDAIGRETAPVVVATPHDYFDEETWRQSEHYNLVRR
ncbi:MAG TPA: hypothetical protein VGB55_01050, partial [Tepidisphaeraceae bacterium]